MCLRFLRCLYTEIVYHIIWFIHRRQLIEANELRPIEDKLIEEDGDDVVAKTSLNHDFCHNRTNYGDDDYHYDDVDDDDHDDDHDDHDYDHVLHSINFLQLVLCSTFVQFLGWCKQHMSSYNFWHYRTDSNVFLTCPRHKDRACGYRHSVESVWPYIEEFC